MQGPQPRRPSVGSARGLLGVAADADADELGRAYRRRARLMHPDISLEPDATEQFRMLQAAYQVALAAARSDTPIAGTPMRGEPQGRTVAADAADRGGGIAVTPRPVQVRVAWLAAGPVHVQPSREPNPGTAATPADGRT